MRARILRDLRRGDQARIAEAVGTAPEYVKHIMRYRPNAKRALARRDSQRQPPAIGSG